MNREEVKQAIETIHFEAGNADAEELDNLVSALGFLCESIYHVINSVDEDISDELASHYLAKSNRSLDSARRTLKREVSV